MEDAADFVAVTAIVSSHSLDLLEQTHTLTSTFLEQHTVIQEGNARNYVKTLIISLDSSQL